MTNIIKRPLSEITVPEGRRGIDPVEVSKIADSIKTIGRLLCPIIIDKNGRLIAGAHRLEAHKLLGHDEIECIVLDADELRTELAEIDENLIRTDLDDISMGEQAIRRDEILEQLGLRANQSNKGKSTGESDSPVKTTADFAKDIGTGERTLQQNMQLARDLEPVAKEAVRKIGAKKGDALKLSRKTPMEQEAIAQKILEGGATTLVEATSAVLAELSDDELDKWIEMAKQEGGSNVDAMCERNRRLGGGEKFQDEVEAGKHAPGFCEKQIRKIKKASETKDAVMKELHSLFLATLGWTKSLADEATLAQILNSEIEQSKSFTEKLEALRAEFVVKDSTSTPDGSPSNPPHNSDSGNADDNDASE